MSEHSVWKEGPFRWLWFANASTTVARSLGVFAISVTLVNVVGASAFQVGLAAPLSSLGPLLCGLFAGVVVDRWGNRRVMIVTTWGRMAAYAGAVAAYVTGWLGPWHLLVVIFLVSVADVFFMSAHTSILPRIVGRARIPAATSSLMASDQIIALAGPAAGGQLVRLFPAPLVLAVSVIGQLSALVGLKNIPHDANRVSGQEASPRQRVREAIVDGAKFMARNRLLLAVILTTATNTCAAGVYQAAQSWFILKDLDIEPAVFGAIWSVSAVGGITGALIAPRLGSAWGPLRAMFFASLLMPMNFALIPLAALWPHLAVWSIGLSFTLFGLALGVLSVNSATLVVALTPDTYLARVAATRRTVTQGAMLLGGLVGALLLAWVGAVPSLWVAVAIATGQGIFLVRVGVLRRGSPTEAELVSS